MCAILKQNPKTTVKVVSAVTVVTTATVDFTNFRILTFDSDY